MNSPRIEVQLDDGTLYVPRAYAEAVFDERFERGHLTVSEAQALVEKWERVEAS